MNTINQITKLKPTILLLIFGIFLINLGSFLVIPYVAIYLTKYRGLSIIFASSYLTINLICQRMLSVIGGMLADSYGAKNIIIAGLVLRTIAYFLLGFFLNPIVLLISAILMGCGSSFYSPASKVQLLKLSDDAERMIILTLRSIAMNSGVAFGPLLGVLVFHFNPHYIFLICILLYVLVCSSIIVFLPNIKEINAGIKNYIADFRSLSHSSIRNLFIIMIIFMIGYLQIEVAIPLFIQSIIGKGGVALFFALNAGLCIMLAIPMLHYMQRFSNDHCIIISLVLIGMSFFICGITTKHAVMLFSAILFTFAEIIFLPNFDSKLYQQIPRNIAGIAFGIADLAVAIGGLLGVMIGGWMFNLISAMRNDVGLYWLGLSALIISFSIFYFHTIKKKINFQ